jgi:hypothetical protein
MADPEVVKLQAQLHKVQGQLNDVLKDRDNLNKGERGGARVFGRSSTPPPRTVGSR